MFKIYACATTLSHISKTLADSHLTNLIITADVAAAAAVGWIVVGIRAPSSAVTKPEVGASKALQALPMDATLAFGASIRALTAMI